MDELMPGTVERAVKTFRDHKARYVRGPSFDVLDWKRPDTITCWVRMVFDHERPDTKAVYISGDLGEAVVYPTCQATLADMATCFTRRLEDGSIEVNEQYFLEKVKASSHLYEWDLEWFKNDLRKAFRDEYGDDDNDKGKLEEWFEEYCDGYLPNVVVDNGVQMTDSFAQDAIRDIFPDYDTWIYWCGRRVSDWVGFWLVALRLAHEQLISADPEWKAREHAD